ncbi:hypothetical protein P389DRAFT_16486 [Cystobasidium minutum MCA 4210]|uniref:uncharacterized protein n=1 Tax=Cystobasidium minutum MCA 4210 TaxID=1397322 RepID=UPI0034D00B1C|eukprot:jgi/Rhomi1/16486/CE16485_11418
MSQVYAAMSSMSMRGIRGSSSSSRDEEPQSSTADNNNHNNIHKKREDAAVEFSKKRDDLLASIETSQQLVASLGAFNESKWTLHYPHQQLGYLDATSSSSKAQRNEPPRRAASMFGEASSSTSSSTAPTSTEEASIKNIARPSLHIRAMTMAPQAASSSSTVSSPIAAEKPTSKDDASVNVTSTSNNVKSSAHPLAIDLRVGAPGQTSMTALMDRMSLATIAQLLSERFDVASEHLAKLQSRVRDGKSRILVTGDLNSGKSTFVNALLRRDILPTDQQPLTTVFCEVLDAQAYNEGKEEVHAITRSMLDKYERTKEETYQRFDLSELETIATDEDQKYGLVKVYLEDSRAPISSSVTSVVDHEIPAEVEAATNSSFIRNGIVSISLIDGPGLNQDTSLTTQVFSRQSEIDVVVFMVSADNGLTQSAKEFLWNAALEKAYIFIVVNKWKSIRDKVKCRRRVMDDIKNFSPRTFEKRDELVHFVEAAAVVEELSQTASEDKTPSAKPEDESFANLEESLRSFLLLKRLISKLDPSKNYLSNLLTDLANVAQLNIEAADCEYEEFEEKLKILKPIHEKLQKEREIVEEAVGKEEEEHVDSVRNSAKQTLTQALETLSHLSSTASEIIPEYPGILAIWDWAAQVKASLVNYVESQTVKAEDDARVITVKGVETVSGELATRFLPTVNAAGSTTSNAAGAASALPQRVFRPEVMFRKRREAIQKKRDGHVSLKQLKEQQAQYQLSSRAEIELSFMDLFDTDRLLSLGTYLHVGGGQGKSSNALISSHDAVVEAGSALSVVSLGVGAVTMFGTKVVGLKSVIEALTSLTELLGSKAARKWAGPLAALASILLAGYIIHDLPRAIPHNIGKKLHAQLTNEDFVIAESDRICRETRKVMRLAGWDLRERFRAALEASEKDRREVEGRLKKADEAIVFLEEYLGKVEETKEKVSLIDLEPAH